MFLGSLGHAPSCLPRDLPWERRELGFHKISLVQIFLIRSSSLPAPAPYNANSVSRLCATKLSSTLVFFSFFGNEDKISKSALEDNLLTEIHRQQLPHA
jgi:hypothetical protein